MLSRHGLSTSWKQVALYDSHRGTTSRTAENIASVTDAVEEIFFAAYPIRTFFGQFASLHMDIMSAVIYTTTYIRYRSKKRIEIII